MTDGGGKTTNGEKIDALRVGMAASVSPILVTVAAQGDHVLMRFDFRLTREEALRFAQLVMTNALAVKP